MVTLSNIIITLLKVTGQTAIELETEGMRETERQREIERNRTTERD